MLKIHTASLLKIIQGKKENRARRVNKWQCGRILFSIFFFPFSVRALVCLESYLVGVDAKLSRCSLCWVPSADRSPPTWYHSTHQASGRQEAIRWLAPLISSFPLLSLCMMLCRFVPELLTCLISYCCWCSTDQPVFHNSRFMGTLWTMKGMGERLLQGHHVNTVSLYSIKHYSQ